jgi:hypothetical protein
MRSGIKWSFETARFRVELELMRDRGYRYDGEDEDGETQRKLDSGEYVAFDSCVRVLLDGEEIASDWLGGSVYADGEEPQFWTAHRDSDFTNRNCSLMRIARGSNVCICHYFPDMVRQAISEARAYIAKFPKVRAA